MILLQPLLSLGRLKWKMIVVMKSGTQSNVRLKRVTEIFCNEGTIWIISHFQSTPLQDGRSSAGFPGLEESNLSLKSQTSLGVISWFWLLACWILLLRHDSLGVLLGVSTHPPPPLHLHSHCKAVISKL